MLPNQTFSATDIPVIAVLILLEGLLSADNALVLAIMVKHLPDKLRQRALLYGLGGAFVFRGLALLAASWIIKLWWLQLIGALYLVFITIKHFVSHAQEENDVKTRSNLGFWQTVLLVEFTDIAFAVDSVVAAVGVIKGPDKLWVAYAGALIGVILLRWAAGLFIKLLDRFPALEHVAYLLVGWVGVKLVMMSGHNYEKDALKNPALPKIPFEIHEMDPRLFWGGMALIGLGGFLVSWLGPKKKPEESPKPEQEH